MLTIAGATAARGAARQRGRGGARARGCAGAVGVACACVRGVSRGLHAALAVDEHAVCPADRLSAPRYRAAPLSALARIFAGFADNQNYGFGGNSMTEGQKSNLIFGGLFIGFLLLMSGYLLT